jgi:hypothetical protein
MQEGRKKEARDKVQISREHSHRPTSFKKIPPPNNDIKLLIHQGINPFIG